jgi:hypothetical protein
MTGRLKQDLAKEARLADAEEAASRGVQEDVETDE